LSGTGEGVKFRSLAELRQWLTIQGIPHEKWGVGATKTVWKLWGEISSGEAVMTENPPRRRIAAVSVEIEVDRRKLVEARQRLANGAVRERGSEPAEKMLPGETADITAERCLREELEVEGHRIELDERTASNVLKVIESPSYPGLPTHYLLWKISAKVDDLPLEDFTTEEATGSNHEAVLTHYWEWHRRVDPPAAAQAAG
jgi:hypothetical protein